MQLLLSREKNENRGSDSESLILIENSTIKDDWFQVIGKSLVFYMQYRGKDKQSKCCNFQNTRLKVLILFEGREKNVDVE